MLVGGQERDPVAGDAAVEEGAEVATKKEVIEVATRKVATKSVEITKGHTAGVEAMIKKVATRSAETTKGHTVGAVAMIKKEAITSVAAEAATPTGRVAAEALTSKIVTQTRSIVMIKAKAATDPPEKLRRSSEEAHYYH